MSLRDLRQRAIVAAAYDSLCRASELVALRVKDITPAADEAATVLVRRAKNDQEGEGSVRYLCPDTMNHVRAWVAAAALADGELFRAVLKGAGWAARSTNVKLAAPCVNWRPRQPGAVSAHSTRVGVERGS